MSPTLRFTVFFGLLLLGHSSVAYADELPNIIVILADDLGYGDVQCLNPERGKIVTPHMDQVASDGMIFTDAHTTSSVCTPTRYSLLTGRYNWRTTKQSGVLDGYGLPLIAKDRMTIPSFLKSQGYNTAMIGKWHLGLSIATHDGKKASPIKKALAPNKGKGVVPAESISNIDWKGEIKGGPVDVGFDSWFGITASLDFPPYVWIRDRHWQGVGNVVKAFSRNGPASEDFEAIDVLDRLTEEVEGFIGAYESPKPFFAYIPLPSPHTPIVPTEKWQGKSGINSYADFVMQTDDVVGRIVAALKQKGITDNTLLIVTSDNGCSKRADFKTLEEHGHYASAQFRGSKSDIWDGGHRVPFLVKWPNVIAAGSTSDQLVCQTDLLATCGEIVAAEIPASAGEDSESILPLFSGKPVSFTRKGIIHHSVNGTFAYREGNYKLLLTRASGGWTRADDIGPKAPPAQLYDIASDPGEKNNLYLENPEIADRLLTHLTDYVTSGSTVEGKESKNDLETIKLWKGKRR